jgi:hypothetical protein
VNAIITVEQARKDNVEAKWCRLEDEALSHVHHQCLHQGENCQANQPMRKISKIYIGLLFAL